MADIRIVVGADIPKTKSVVKDDLKVVARQINQEQIVANVKLGLDVNATKKLFEDKLNTIVGGIKIKPVTVKVNLDTSTATSKSSAVLPTGKKYSLAQYDLNQTKKANAILLTDQKHTHTEFMNQSNQRIQARKEEVELAALLQKQEKLNATKTKDRQIFGSIDNGNIDKELSIYKTKVEQLKKSFVNTDPTVNADMDSKMSQLETSLKSIQTLKQHNGTWDFGSNELATAIAQYREYESILKKTIQLNSSQKSVKFANQNDLNNLENFINALQKYRELNDRVEGNSGLKNELDGFQKKADKFKSSGAFDDSDVKKLTASLGETKIKARDLGLEGQKWTTKLSSQVQKLGVYMSASTILMSAISQVKQMVGNVIELDTAMTELKKVTNETDASYSKFLDKAEVRAKKLGATLTDTIRATAD